MRAARAPTSKARRAEAFLQRLGALIEGVQAPAPAEALLRAAAIDVLSRAGLYRACDELVIERPPGVAGAIYAALLACRIAIAQKDAVANHEARKGRVAIGLRVDRRRVRLRAIAGSSAGTRAADRDQACQDACCRQPALVSGGHPRRDRRRRSKGKGTTARIKPTDAAVEGPGIEPLV